MELDIKEKASNKTKNHEKGAWGEDMACKYIESVGYIILERNYRCPFGEIDIVAIENNIYVFIEVKMRSSIKYGVGSYAIDYYKRNRIKNSAKYYMKTKNITGIRFDVIEITKYKKIYYGKVIKNAF